MAPGLAAGCGAGTGLGCTFVTAVCTAAGVARILVFVFVPADVARSIFAPRVVAVLLGGPVYVAPGTVVCLVVVFGDS